MPPRSRDSRTSEGSWRPIAQPTSRSSSESRTTRGKASRRAEPAQVELVMIGGDVAYGRANLVETVVGKDLAARYEPQLAWGKPMLLDNSYEAHPGAEKMPTLTELRAALIKTYPQVGPIYA
jgi:hypothetical protein